VAESDNGRAGNVISQHAADYYRNGGVDNAKHPYADKLELSSYPGASILRGRGWESNLPLFLKVGG